MSACNCPNPTSLTDISASNCPFHLGQIQGIIPQRRGDKFDAVNTIDVLASWTTKLGAVDNTKVVKMPIISGNPIITPGGAITSGGGDNSTLNGIEEVNGTNPSVFTAEFRGLTPAQATEIKLLNCEKQLAMYFIVEADKFLVKDLGAGEYGPIPIDAFHLDDRMNEGFGTQDKHMVRFSLKAGWESDVVLVSATDFSPLNDLTL